MKNGKNVTVLLVDDNEMMRTVLRVILHSEGYDVVGEAHNGKNGLELARKLRPDIICLDIIMPDSDGLEVLREIRREVPSAVVLMVTVNNDRNTVQTAIKRGASGFIIKPFNSGTVIDTVNQAVKLIGVARAPLESDDKPETPRSADTPAAVDPVVAIPNTTSKDEER